MGDALAVIENIWNPAFQNHSSQDALGNEEVRRGVEKDTKQ